MVWCLSSDAVSATRTNANNPYYAPIARHNTPVYISHMPEKYINVRHRIGLGLPVGIST